MTTSLGSINVQLFKAQTPITVANFFAYANSGAWDGTFFHRNAHLLADNSRFIIQAGGFDVKSDNTLGIVPHNPPIQNEPGISNKRGTIAMAKLSKPVLPEFPSAENSATNQFFFNEQDNSHNSADLDEQNGGFTVFGQITNGSGLGVMDSIGMLPNKDLRTGNQNDANNPTVAMDDTPVLNPNATAATLNPSVELVVIRRVAIINKVSAFVIG
jgi:peptidyl-prolyl cis-trans isomerase A (cyclophilin A)